VIEVTPPGGEPFRDQVSGVYHTHQLARLPVGSVYRVFYDAKRKKIKWDPQDPTIQRLLSAGKQTETSGQLNDRIQDAIDHPDQPVARSDHPTDIGSELLAAKAIEAGSADTGSVGDGPAERRAANLEALQAQGLLTGDQVERGMQYPDVAKTMLIPTPDGLSRVFLKADGTVVFHKAGESEAPVSSAADELQKLVDLNSRGLLTDAEFTAAKATMLGL
jgi:hypothetical protein